MRLIQRLLAIAIGGSLCAVFSSVSLAESLQSQLIGTWTLVSEIHTDHGMASEPYGPHPIGIAIYDSTGYFSTQRMRPDLPKFAANTKNEGTDAENKAVVQGMMTLFGTYTVDEQTHTRHLHILGSSYPNIAGSDLKESIAISGDLMTVTNPVTTLVWQRAK